MAMELPLEHVLRENGPIDQMAERLISGAQREAGVRAQPVDVVHLMMAVVLDPWPIHEVHDSPAIRMLLSDARAMDELRGALRMQMNAQPFNSPQRSHPSGPLYGTTAYEPLCTGALRRCMELARKHWPTLPLNDSMLVWAVLNDNNDARDAVIAILADLPEHRFDAIVSDLEGRVRRNAPYHEPMSYPAVDHSRWMPIKLLPHPTYQHLVRHRGLMLEIADAIQGREHGQIVLVSGHNGSPLHHVAQILTDAIGEGTIHFGDIQSV